MRRRGWSRWLPRLAALAVVASLVWVFAGQAVSGMVSGWFSSGDARYCQAVSDHQTELTDLSSDSSPDGILKVLPIYEDLLSKANSQIRPDWQLLVTRIKALQKAFDDAGVDPATYSPASSTLPPDKKQAIQAAASALVAPDALQASAEVQQQARDVCQTPLTQ